MSKTDLFLKRITAAIRRGKFADEKYRSTKTYRGVAITTYPLFCSYGKIGYSVLFEGGQIEYDWELDKLRVLI